MNLKSWDSDAPVPKDAQPRASPIVQTPCPYEQGKSVDLLVTKTFSDEIDFGQLTATVTKLISMKMSPVTEIVYETKSGGTRRGVLKVFDRRFGQSFRKVPGLHELVFLGHTTGLEAAWRGYVREGKAEAFFEEIRNNQERNDNTLPRGPAKYFIQRRPDRKARYEGALQYNCLRSFENETRAFERLADLEGQSIPKLLAHVRVLVEADDLNTEGTEGAEFFRVNGIIMEQIEGFSLDDLLSSPLTADRWEDVLQRTVDSTKEINIRGVVMSDCRSGNVMVQTSNGTPIIHDFAQANTWDSKDNDKRIEALCQNNNPKHIVWSLVTRAEREKGMKLRIVYPNLDRIFNLKSEENE